MTSRPQISVVMPVYNGERDVREAIESVLVESRLELELVVVDDGSTDSTPQILAEYAAADRRLVVRRRQNAGSAAALNHGIAAACGPLIARLDSDDLALPDRLWEQHRFLRANEQAQLVGGQAQIVDEAGAIIAEAHYPLTDRSIRETFARSTPFVHSGVTMRREAFERAGGYRPCFEPAEDLDLWLRIAELGELANLPQTVVAYRVHAGQASARKIEAQAIRALAARTAADLRARGRPDPFAGEATIDERSLAEAGVSRAQIDSAVVDAAIWMAKTMGRAGHSAAARDLFETAAVRARSAAEPAPLLASVQRAEAARLAESGRLVRSRLRAVRAALTERRRRPAY